MKLRNCIRLIFLVVVAALATGCSKSGDSKKATTQVAAKVNSDEITIGEINRVLAQTPNLPPEAAVRAKRQILDKLIDQELAKQQAISKKLDRTPNVLQALEAAKTEILARAYLEQISVAQPRPTPEEIKKYYADHPELFSQRRLYNIEEINVPPNAAKIEPALTEQVRKARTMLEIANWLKAQGTAFVPGQGVRAAEQIPFESLAKLQKMKDGEIQIFKSPAGGLQIVRIVASRPAPVNEEAAAPRIQQFLFNLRSNEAVAKEMKQIKEGAKIEYLGEFAGDVAAAEAKAKAEAEAKAKTTAEAKAKDAAEAKERADAIAKARKDAEERARAEQEAKSKAGPAKGVQVPQETIEKGARGLR